MTKSDTDICVYGQDIWALWPLPLDLPYFVLRPVSGTSIAAPQVAAAAALVKVAHPGWGSDRIERALKETARDLGAPGRDDEYGYGALDAEAALKWSSAGDPCALSAGAVSVAGGCTYTGKPLEPEMTVKVGGKVLAKGTDYLVTGYANNVNAGTATVTIVGRETTPAR